mmetsp:Transcript_41780/g.77307  ORF Transcript_41780/g.77307 Transcript_41780/m.77307 type:complete len:99 (+) Transcript_41780:1086-1382(+)
MELFCVKFEACVNQWSPKWTSKVRGETQGQQFLVKRYLPREAECLGFKSHPQFFSWYHYHGSRSLAQTGVVPRRIEVGKTYEKSCQEGRDGISIENQT